VSVAHRIRAEDMPMLLPAACPDDVFAKSEDGYTSGGRDGLGLLREQVDLIMGRGEYKEIKLGSFASC
jgi:hypothetical protein